MKNESHSFFLAKTTRFFLKGRNMREKMSTSERLSISFDLLSQLKNKRHVNQNYSKIGSFIMFFPYQYKSVFSIYPFHPS